MSFKFEKTEIEGVLLVIPQIHHDSRGLFMETFREDIFQEQGIPKFVQDNRSKSIMGVIRGIHFQKYPKPQGKLVSCTMGCIFDVAVDLRKGSPTYKKWIMEELNDYNGHMLYVAAGCGHAFLATSLMADVSYRCTNYYNKELDAGIRWDDPDIGIDWNKTSLHFAISEKDKNLPFLKDIS